VFETGFSRASSGELYMRGRITGFPLQSVDKITLWFLKKIRLNDLVVSGKNQTK
jgi:hypothetical protein